MIKKYEYQRSKFENNMPFSSNKTAFVSRVFDSVAKKYDLMNDLMSFGIHRSWKNTLVSMLGQKPSTSLVDIGGGTGDIAFRFLNEGGKEVKIVDNNYNMLDCGRDRSNSSIYKNKIVWINGNAEELPLASYSADALTTSFCLRNVSNIKAALNEACRVLKPGGRFFCLEFSQVTNPILDQIYNTYSSAVIPWLGDLITQDRISYQYLVDSIQGFPSQEHFSNLIREAGFVQVKYRNLSGGVAAIHSAWRV